jgi:competence protein ComEA
MPTPSEQKALAFVAIVIVLGGAVRVLRAGSPPTATSAEQQAIARQAAAAESASVHDSRGKKGYKSGKMAQRRRDSVPNVAAGVANGGVSPSGFPPPSPRIDVDNRLPGGVMVVGARVSAGNRQSGGTGVSPLDLDVASAAEIEALPRIGPALAGRIVASRDSAGPFGSLEGLGRVRGIGPAMLRQLGPLVTFSGRAASSGVWSRY